jgi:hypothetical protein
VAIALLLTSVFFQFNHYSHLHGNVGQVEILQEELAMKEGELAEMKSAMGSETRELQEKLDTLQTQLVAAQERLLEEDGEREEAEELLLVEQQKNHEGNEIAVTEKILKDGDKKAMRKNIRGKDDAVLARAKSSKMMHTRTKAELEVTGVGYRPQDQTNGPLERIEMEALYDTLPVGDPDMGTWKQGFNLRVEPEMLDRQNGTLNVFVVPHSHNDPGNSPCKILVISVHLGGP